MFEPIEVSRISAYRIPEFLVLPNGDIPLEMSQIRYFRALVEELNFTRAAERCQVSQPALTRSIRLLEQEFGGALFNRERNETHLSELGRIVQPHIDEIYEQARLAAQGARQFASLEQAQLKLGVMCTVAPKDLIQLIAGVRTRHPGIRVELANSTAPELDEALRGGELELAILCKAEDDHDAAFHYQPLFREQFVIATVPDHPFARQDFVRVADLGKEPYLRRINCEFGEIAGRVFRANGCAVQTVYRSDRDDWILAMTAAGMGFSFLPKFCADHPGVITRPLVDPEFWREVSLVTVRGRQHSPAVGALVHEAMQATWKDGMALSVEKFAKQQKGAG